MASGEQDRPQKKPAVAPYLAALAAIGLATFAFLGWIVGFRETHPITASAPAAAVDGVPTAGAGGLPASPLDALAEGARRSATAAARGLAQGERSAAAEAMDAARLATAVGRYAAAGPARQAFEQAMGAVRAARHALQTGDPAGARGELTRAAAALPAASSTATGVPATAPHDWAAYDGARLLNAEGRAIGAVDHVRPASDAGAPRAELTLGGYHQVLGAFDFGGERVTVSADRVVFGEPRTIGPVDVVLATMARDPETIIAGLGVDAVARAP